MLSTVGTPLQDYSEVLLGDAQGARDFLKRVPHPADLYDVFLQVEVEHWSKLLTYIEDEDMRAQLVTLFSEGERERVFENLEPGAIAQLVQEMVSDDAVDVLGELDPAEQVEALAALSHADREAFKRLLDYDEDCAGGLMQLEMAVVSRSQTIAQIRSRVHDWVNDSLRIHQIYVVDTHQRLLGGIDLVRLLLHADSKSAGEIMKPVVAFCPPDTDQEEVAELFRKYDIVALPVLDDDGRLLGRVIVDDIVDVVDEEAEEDVLLMGGTNKEELLFHDDASQIARIRLPWLLVNLIGSLLSASLLFAFNSVLLEAIVIAAFIPVITAMGGNVGTQSATIAIRALATGRLKLEDLVESSFRELRVGLLMGSVCGLVVGCFATLFSKGLWVLGVVVALSMITAMSAAAVVGSAAPFLLKRFEIDPAIAAGPFVTTTNDLIGIFVYMSTALLFLDWLT